MLLGDVRGLGGTLSGHLGLAVEETAVSLLTMMRTQVGKSPT